MPETSGWQVTGGDHFMCACVYPGGSTPGLQGQVLSAVSQNGSADDTQMARPTTSQTFRRVSTG